MPPNPNPHDDAKDNKRWLLGLGLAILLAANLALVAVLAVGAWRDFIRPLDYPLPGTTSAFQNWFDIYRDRVDSLSKLVTALIGLSALYSTVIGITAYLSAQFYVDRFKESLKESRERSEKQLAEFEERFPSFQEMNRAVSRIINLLAELVPDVERLADHEAALTPQLIERIQHYERSIAFFEFLKEDGGPNSREVYRRLGRFYRALFEREKKRMKARGTPLSARRKAPADCSSAEMMAYALFDRAEFYIDHLLRKDSDNFAALNEKAILMQEIDGSDRSPRAREYFERSIENNSRQQRALYWLGYIQMDSSDERELIAAEKTFTRALAQDLWEHDKSSPERKADLFYNRACVRAKLGLSASRRAGAAPKEADTWADRAIDDLVQCSTAPSSSFLESLLEDIAPNRDLWWLNRVREEKVNEIRKRLGDTTLP